MTPRSEVAEHTARPPHLSEDELQQLRGALVAQRAAHLAQLDECDTTLDEHTDENGDTTRDLVDVAAARSRDAIEVIESALARIDAWTYGTCERCGAAIPFERLEAIPHTARCIACPDSPAGLLG